MDNEVSFHLLCLRGPQVKAGKTPARDPQKRTTSAAYMTFVSDQDYKDFLAECSGHTFLDEKGSSPLRSLLLIGGNYKMQIELALYQKIPSKKPQAPSKCGTYAESEEYKKFIERISKEPEKPLSADLIEDVKAARQVAPLVVELNETLPELPPPRGKKPRYPTKDERKYMIRKRPQQPSADLGKDEARAKGKGYYGGGKNGGVVYRRKQPMPKEEEK